MAPRRASVVRPVLLAWSGAVNFEVVDSTGLRTHPACFLPLLCALSSLRSSISASSRIAASGLYSREEWEQWEMSLR